MELTHNQKEEIRNLQKAVKQYEGILRISRDPESIARTRANLKKVKDKLDILCPNGVPIDLIYSEEEKSPSKVNTNDTFNGCAILSKFLLQKASPHCEDRELNILATLIRVWDINFSPVLIDQYVRLDFSTSAERDSHFNLLEGIKRRLKVVGDSIENFHLATKENAKIQLREVRSRYIHNFLIDGTAFIKKIKDFWSIVLNDIKQDGMRCMNANEIIKLDPSFETPTYLDKKTVAKVIEMACLFLEEGLELIGPKEFSL